MSTKNRKRPLEQPESPRPKKRPKKRVETTLSSPSARSQSTGYVDPDKSIVSEMSEVDIAVNEYLNDHRLAKDKLDEFRPESRNRILRNIFQIIVSQPESHKKLDPTIPKMVHPVKYGDRWDAFVESHPDLIDVLLECCSLDPPSFNKVLELGPSILMFAVSRFSLT